MEKEKLKSIPTKFSNYEMVNDTVSKVKISIMYGGKNRNGSYMSKETIESAIPTLYGAPVIGEYEGENFGGHGGKIVIDSNGIEFIETTKPWGFIDASPEYANVRWEEVEDENGNKMNYLVADAYLWRKRYPELDIVFEKGANQSMEIDLNDYAWSDELDAWEIKDFSFSALCILGYSENKDENVEPCFESASVKAYSLDKDTFKAEFSLMVQEIKDSFTVQVEEQVEEQVIVVEEVVEESTLEFAVSKEEMGTGDSIEISMSKEDADMEGSWGSVDKTKLRNDILIASNYQTLVEKCYLMVMSDWEDSPSSSLKYPVCVIKDGKLVLSADGCQTALAYLEQNTDDPMYAEAKSKLKKYYTILDLDTESFAIDEEVIVDPIVEEPIVKERQFHKFELSFSDIEGKLHYMINEIDEDGWMNCKYWICEMFPSYAIIRDTEENEYYKLPYVIDEEDNIMIGEKVEVYSVWLTEDEKDSLESMKSEYAMYQEKEQLEAQALLDSQKDEVFEKYDELLSENEAYAQIKASKNEYSVDSLEEKLAVLYVKSNVQFSAKQSNKSSIVKLGNDDELNKKIKPVADPYGGLFTKTN